MEQENTREIALNTHLLLHLIGFAAFLLLTVDCAFANEVGGAFVFGFFGVFILFCFFVSPLYFVFDESSVIIVYHFGLRESILWKNTRSIYVSGSWIGKQGPPRYVFAYPCKEKRMFFICGEISKTRKTTRLIKKYYKNKIK